MKKPYTPKGKTSLLIAEMEKDLMREFTSREASQIMGCDLRAVGAFLEYSMRHGLVFRRSDGRTAFYRGAPYREGQERGEKETPNQTKVRNGYINCVQPVAGWVTSADDVRCQKVVPGWTPPKMVCTRPGAGEWHSEEIAA